MSYTTLPNADHLRTRFSFAMSDMYKKEVPLYADLLSIVADVDGQVGRRWLNKLIGSSLYTHYAR